MTIRIPIRQLLDLRSTIPDHVLLDYLDLAIIAPDPGFVSTADLCKRWDCHRSSVSRRLAAVQHNGLAELTAVYGGYQIHYIKTWQP